MTKDEIVVQLANEDHYEYGVPDNLSFQLAELEFEDMKRKGCLCETAHCYECRMFAKCPMHDWEKRHPEYVNDELARKIRELTHNALG